MEDLTKMQYREVIRYLEASRAHGIQIVKNDFGFIWPDSNLSYDEIIRGRLFVFNGNNFVGISEKDNVSRRYVSFTEDFLIVQNLYSDMYEIYVRNNPNNILNKIRWDSKWDTYNVQINEGIVVLTSDTKAYAVSNTGHLKQISKGPQSQYKYTILRSRKVRGAYDIYQNTKLLMTVDANLKTV